LRSWGTMNPLLNDLEAHIVKAAKQHDANTLYLRQTVPGSGKILSLALLDAIHERQRFPSGQDCASSGRLGKWAKASAGKRDGTAGTQIGKAYLKWAFSEAAVLFLRANPEGQQYLSKLEKQHGTGKALPVLAQQLARAVYYMLKRGTAFDRALSLHGEGRRGGEPAASLGHQRMSLASQGSAMMSPCVCERP
jgi:transposase